MESEISKRIRKVYRHLGITQKEFCLRMGVSKTTLFRWLKGDIPDKSQLHMLSHLALNAEDKTEFLRLAGAQSDAGGAPSTNIIAEDRQSYLETRGELTFRCRANEVPFVEDLVRVLRSPDTVTRDALIHNLAAFARDVKRFDDDLKARIESLAKKENIGS